MMDTNNKPMVIKIVSAISAALVWAIFLIPSLIWRNINKTESQERVLSKMVYGIWYVLCAVLLWVVLIVPYLVWMNAKLIWHAMTTCVKYPDDMLRVMKNSL